jgi:hypothetical protein
MRPRFRLATLMVALMAMLVAAPVAAANSWQTFSQSGTQAFAFEGACTDNPGPTVTCENQSLDVFKGKEKATGEPSRHSERVCYSQSSDTFNPKTGVGAFEGVFGCAEEAGILTINDLESIVLASTVIELTAFSCTYTPDTFECTEGSGGSVAVEGTWTGEGPVFTNKGRFRFDDGTCMQVNADKGSFREASFDGGAEGDPIEANFAGMGQGSFTFRTNCPF